MREPTYNVQRISGLHIIPSECFRMETEMSKSKQKRLKMDYGCLQFHIWRQVSEYRRYDKCDDWRLAE